MKPIITTPGNALYVALSIKALLETNMHFGDVVKEAKEEYEGQFGKSKWFTDDVNIKVTYLEERTPGIVNFIFQGRDASISDMNVNFAASCEPLFPVSRDVGIVCFLENKGKLLFLKQKSCFGFLLPFVDAVKNSTYQCFSHQYDFSGMRGTIIPGYGVLVPYKMCEMLKAFNTRGKVLNTKIFTTPLCERGLVKRHDGIPRFWFPVVIKTQGSVNKQLYKEVPLDEAEKWLPSELEYEIFRECYGKNNN